MTTSDANAGPWRAHTAQPSGTTTGPARMHQTISDPARRRMTLDWLRASCAYGQRLRAQDTARLGMRTMLQERRASVRGDVWNVFKGISAQNLLDALADPRQRQAVMLRAAMDGVAPLHSLAEIATLLGVSPATAKRDIAAGLDALWFAARAKGT